MTIKEILNITNHRPWKIPRGSWKFYQEWNNAVFLHWQVELAELKIIEGDSFKTKIIYAGKDIDKVSRFYRSFSIINYLLFGVSNKDK